MVEVVMRPGRCGDDESDSYSRVGYRHFMDSSWACLALVPRFTSLRGAWVGASRVALSLPRPHHRLDL